MIGPRIARVIGTCLLLSFASAAEANSNSLVVEQIGTDNRAATWQGDVPTATAAGQALGVDPNALSFAVRDAGELSGAGEELSLTDMISEFEGLSGGSNNSATLRQEGARNRAIHLQVAGSNNRMLTEQYGNDNVAVHLHRGNGNDTQMIQHNGGNETALIATGGATGNDGGPLRMEATGNVKGFGVRASGAQSYSTITVGRNGKGGFNINLGTR